MKPVTVLICFLIVSALLFVWIKVLRSFWTKTSGFRTAVIKLTVFVSTWIYILLILEFLFYSVVIFSDGFGVTLSAQRWAEKYWHPVNSFGYRDVEHSAEDFHNKRVIFMVGDSLTAGHGIKRVQDRFSDILQQNMGSQYLVVNIARGGWDSTYEYNAIASYPFHPDRIVLEYFVNDIDGVARKAGLLPAVFAEPPKNPAMSYVVNHSYLLNFIYWRLYRLKYKDTGNEYWQDIKQSYANPEVWAAHVADLDKIVTFTQQRGIGLTVVIFPNLAAIKDSADITSKVDGFFQTRHVRVLDLEPVVEGRDPSSLVVNSLDSHPNEALHKEVAELLTKEAKEQGW